MSHPTDTRTRIAVVDSIHPDLCQALTGMDDAPDRLARLTRDTPIFIVNDTSEWCRLHGLAGAAIKGGADDHMPSVDPAGGKGREGGDFLGQHGARATEGGNESGSSNKHWTLL